MRLDLTRAGIWPRRGGRDRKTWRDLKRDYVVQLLLQRTIVELDQASGRSEGTEGETRKARHGRRDTEGEARMQFTVVLDERRGRRGAEGEARKARHGRRGTEGETRMQFTVVLDERRGRRGTEGETRMQFTVVLDERRGRRGTEGETRMQFTVVLDERRGRRGTEGEARKARHGR